MGTVRTRQRLYNQNSVATITFAPPLTIYTLHPAHCPLSFSFPTCFVYLLQQPFNIHLQIDSSSNSLSYLSSVSSSGSSVGFSRAVLIGSTISVTTRLSNSLL